MNWSIPLLVRGAPAVETNVRWNDNRKRWLLQHAAVGLGVELPSPDAEEFEWATSAFSDCSAMTLYVAARKLVDAGRLEEALEVLDDACRAQRCQRTTLRDIPLRYDR